MDFLSSEPSSSLSITMNTTWETKAIVEAMLGLPVTVTVNCDESAANVTDRVRVVATEADEDLLVYGEASEALIDSSRARVDRIVVEPAFADDEPLAPTTVQLAQALAGRLEDMGFPVDLRVR